MFGLFWGLFAICSHIGAVFRDEMHDIKSIDKSKKNNSDTYIDFYGKQRDLNTRKQVYNYIYHEKIYKELYKKSYYDYKGKTYLCETQDGDYIRVFDGSKDLPLNLSARERKKRMEFFKDHPEYKITAVACDNYKTHASKRKINKFIDIKTGDIFVIKSSPYNLGHVCFYCDAKTGDVIRKTDEQLEIDNLNMRNYILTGEWIDKPSSVYIDDNKTRYLINALNKNKRLLEERWKYSDYRFGRIDKEQDLYKKVIGYHEEGLYE